MRDWRNAGLKLLDAIDLSIKSTVSVADDDWFAEIADTVGRGKQRVHDAETIDSLLSCLVATLTELVFVQLGNFPHRRLGAAAPLTPRWWTLTGFRTVQYVQTDKQRAAQAEATAKRFENAKRATETA
jgi:hypothetical protein